MFALLLLPDITISSSGALVNTQYLKIVDFYILGIDKPPDFCYNVVINIDANPTRYGAIIPGIGGNEWACNARCRIQ
jgi:hypothetical protein